jgi:hypothetical protein
VLWTRFYASSNVVVIQPGELILPYFVLNSSSFVNSTSRSKSKDLATRGEQEFFHIFAADPETAAANASDHLVLVIAGRLPFRAEVSKVLDAGDFVSGSAIIFGNLGFQFPERTGTFLDKNHGH